MIYVDTSVVLAHVFEEPRQAPRPLWARADLVTSRVTEFECWVRTNAYGRAGTHGAALAGTLGALAMLAVDERVCARCRAPFPLPARTLDAIHLATADFLRSQGFDVTIATFDRRLADGAAALGLAVVELD